MIPNNLKVGDTFVDGGHTFKVLDIDCAGRYISRRVDKTTLAEVEIPADDVKKEFTHKDVNYEEMSIKELQDLCKKRGLAVRGTKADLAKRLQG